jgi:hypothetical protein
MSVVNTGNYLVTNSPQAKMLMRSWVNAHGNFSDTHDQTGLRRLLKSKMGPPHAFCGSHIHCKHVASELHALHRQNQTAVIRQYPHPWTIQEANRCWIAHDSNFRQIQLDLCHWSSKCTFLGLKNPLLHLSFVSGNVLSM